MGLSMGQKHVKFATNWVQTLRNAYLWNCWMDLPHLKFHGLACCATSQLLAHLPHMGMPMGQKLVKSGSTHRGRWRGALMFSLMVIVILCTRVKCVNAVRMRASWWRHQMENFLRVAGCLCGGSTGHRWIPPTGASDAEPWFFFDDHN